MNINNICGYLPEFKTLGLRDKCFRIEYMAKELANFCCFGELAYPLDGFNKILTTISPYSNYTLFDNALVLNSPPSFETQLVVRGILLYVMYPERDIDGELVEDINMNVGLKMYDYNSVNTFVLPVYNSYMHLSNPVTNDYTKFLDKMEVINTNNFSVTVSGLVLLADREGVSLETSKNKSC